MAALKVPPPVLPGTGRRWSWAKASASASRPLDKTILPFSPESTAAAGGAITARAAVARARVRASLEGIRSNLEVGAGLGKHQAASAQGALLRFERLAAPRAADHAGP
jgi:hypothetical protein